VTWPVWQKENGMQMKSIVATIMLFGVLPADPA
jgi:hypothetical protein